MILHLLTTLLPGTSPCPELPLAPGTTWTYRASVAWTPAGGSDIKRDTITWTTRVLTRKTTDSIAVVTVRDWPAALAWWEPGQGPHTSVLMCTRGRVYLLPASEGTADALADSLIGAIRHPLADDLILQFPLHKGDLFGRDSTDRPDTFYAWYVETVDPMPANHLGWPVGAADSMYTLVYRTMPDHEIVRVVPHLGLVSYTYAHHGTVAEASAELVDFRAGPSDH
jgi:hypothetical protein